MNTPKRLSKDTSSGDEFVPAVEAQLGVEHGALVAGFSVQRSESRRELTLGAGDLLAAITRLAENIEVIVFLDGGSDDDVPVGPMLETLARSGVDVVIRHAPATDAIKRVESGFVVESVDRARFGTLRAPEVVDRKVLEQALRSVDGTTLINPTLLVTANGGSFDVYES